MIDTINSSVDLAPLHTQNAALQNLSSKMHGRSSVAAIEKSAEEFEGVFFAQMLQPMFDSLAVNPLFGGGHGEEVMRSFVVQEYGKAIAKTRMSGIAEAVKAEMIRAQDASHRTTPNHTQGAAYAAVN